MELLRRAMAPWRARRAAEAENDIRGWHEACQTVLATSIQALRDPNLARTDIGVTLDRIDRALFRLRDAGSGAQRALRQWEPELGRRIGGVTEAIVDLRNDTARFLIRAQGPMPSFLQGQGAPSRQPEAYQRAMQDVGLAASGRSTAVESDLRQLWGDLQPTLRRLADSSIDKAG